MPDRMLENMSARMPEHMSDRMIESEQKTQVTLYIQKTHARKLAHST